LKEESAVTLDPVALLSLFPELPEPHATSAKVIARTSNRETIFFMRNPPSADISASYVFYSGACALSFLRLAHFNIRKKYLQYRM
jgi:hypothetical protein